MNCICAAQETFRVENVEGRVVLDILRHVLTACNLSSFSLVDCCQSLLGRRLEVLLASAATSLSKGTAGSERHAHPFFDSLLRLCRCQRSAWPCSSRCAGAARAALQCTVLLLADYQLRHLTCLQA